MDDNIAAAVLFNKSEMVLGWESTLI